MAYLRTSEFESMLTSTADLSEWDSDKKNTYVKHLENNISDLTGELFAI